MHRSIWGGLGIGTVLLFACSSSNGVTGASVGGCSDVEACTCPNGEASERACLNGQLYECQCDTGSSGGAPETPTTFATITACDGSSDARVESSTKDLFVWCARISGADRPRSYHRVAKPTPSAPTPSPAVVVAASASTVNTTLKGANDQGFLVYHSAAQQSGSTVKWIPNGTTTIPLAGITPSPVGPNFYDSVATASIIGVFLQGGTTWGVAFYPPMNNATPINDVTGNGCALVSTSGEGNNVYVVTACTNEVV